MIYPVAGYPVLFERICDLCKLHLENSMKPNSRLFISGKSNFELPVVICLVLYDVIRQVSQNEPAEVISRCLLHQNQ